MPDKKEEIKWAGLSIVSINKKTMVGGLTSGGRTVWGQLCWLNPRTIVTGSD
jgi:hypothetical protein